MVSDNICAILANRVYNRATEKGRKERNRPIGAPAFKALIELRGQQLVTSGNKLPLAAGMQLSAEIVLVHALPERTSCTSRQAW
jgi:hypothetical protein